MILLIPKLLIFKKELNQLKYLLELNKSKSIMNEEDDKKDNMKLSKNVFGKIKQKRHFEP